MATITPKVLPNPAPATQQVANFEPLTLTQEEFGIVEQISMDLLGDDATQMSGLNLDKALDMNKIYVSQVQQLSIMDPIK